MYYFFIQDFMQTSICIGLKKIQLECFGEVFFVLDFLLSAFVNLMFELTTSGYLLCHNSKRKRYRFLMAFRNQNVYLHLVIWI